VVHILQIKYWLKRNNLTILPSFLTEATHPLDPVGFTVGHRIRLSELWSSGSLAVAIRDNERVEEQMALVNVGNAGTNDARARTK
jgi:hypothetical protein